MVGGSSSGEYIQLEKLFLIHFNVWKNVSKWCFVNTFLKASDHFECPDIEKLKSFFFFS